MLARPATVLIVDDELQVPGLAEVILERAGYSTLAARSREEAEALCRAHEGPIDLAVMDVILENDTGMNVLPCLIRYRPGMKVLYTSGCPGRLALANLGMHAPFLPKPFTPDELVSAVRELLSSAAEVQAGADILPLRRS